MTWQVHCGDSRDVLTFYPDECFDSMCTDPPSGIGFMGKNWDKNKGGRDKWIEWLAEILREAFRVLKPGAHCLVWSLPRVSHWTATAVENAGFEIRDIISHQFGSGFPKSLDVGKSIDKQRYDRANILKVTAWIRKTRDQTNTTNDDINRAFGFVGMAGHWTTDTSQPAVPTIEQIPILLEVFGNPEVPEDISRLLFDLNGRKGQPGENWTKRKVTGKLTAPASSIYTQGAVRLSNNVNITAPATDAAKQWDGWGTAIKPSHENWVWAIKPIASKRLIAAMSAATNALEIFLWSMSPVKFARMCSGLNLARSNEAESVSVRWLAGVCLMAESQQRSEAMATFRSQEAGETLLNIAQSWSAIWGAVCRNENTYTTETETALITALQILKLSTSQTTPENTALAQTLKDGEWASVLSAAPNSNAELSSLIATLNTIVPEHAGRHTTDVIHCAIASIAETLTTRRQSTNVYSAGFDATDSADEQASHENWILARKPLIGTVAANVIEHGTGGLNIAACRVAHGSDVDLNAKQKDFNRMGYSGASNTEGVSMYSPAGRWPPNTLFSHSAGCTRIGTTTIKANPAWNDNRPPSSFTGSETSPVHHSDEGKETVSQYECADDCPIAELGRQGEKTTQTLTGDDGTVDRFFPNFHPDPSGFPFFYSAKPSSAERDAGLQTFAPLSGGEATGRVDDSAGTNSPRAGAGRKGNRRNSHPTVKGSELMRWLVRLITPENGIVLDPFCGSGSTGIACVLEGFDFHGIELDPYHCDLACARIAHIDGGGWEPRTEKATAEKPKQGSLF